MTTGDGMKLVSLEVDNKPVSGIGGNNDVKKKTVVVRGGEQEPKKPIEETEIRAASSPKEELTDHMQMCKGLLDAHCVKACARVSRVVVRTAAPAPSGGGVPVPIIVHRTGPQHVIRLPCGLIL